MPTFAELRQQRAQREQQDALGRSLADAAKTTPDAYNRDLQLSQINGMPVDYVQRNRDQMEADAAQKALPDPVALQKDSPALSNWTQDPNNAAIAADDFPTLQALEQGYSFNPKYKVSPSTRGRVNSKPYEDRFSLTQRIGARIKEGLIGLANKIPNAADTENIAALDQYKRTGNVLLGFDRADNPIYAIAPNATETERKEQGARIEKEGVRAIIALNRRTEEADRQIRLLPHRPSTEELNSAETIEQSWAAFKKDPTGIMADIGITSVTQLLPTLALVAATRNPAIAAGVLGGDSYLTERGSGIIDYLRSVKVDTSNQDAVLEALDDDATRAAALRYADTRAAIVGAFDTLSGGTGSLALPEKLIKNRVARELSNALVVNPTIQGALGGSGEASAQLATTGEVKAGQVFAETIGEFATAPVEAGTFAVDRYMEYKQNIERGKLESDRIDQVVKLSQQSKTAQRNPERFNNFLKALGGDVYFPAEKLTALFQTDSEIIAFAEEAGLNADTVIESVLTGADIQMPMDAYVSKVAPKFHEQLKDSIRQSPSTLSPEEAANPDIVRDMEAEVINRFLDSTDDAVVDDAVKKNVSDQLVAAGYKQSDADIQGELYSRFFGVMADRYNKSAEKSGTPKVSADDLFSKYGLQIGEGGQIANGMDIDHLHQLALAALRREAGMPSLMDRIIGDGRKTESDIAGEPVANSMARNKFKEWFGNSKVVDGNGNPKVVYHGTDNDFSVFDRKKLGDNTFSNASDPSYGATSFIGFWFNDKPMGKGDNRRNSPYLIDIPSYVKIENPVEFESLEELAAELDGLIQSGFEDSADVKKAVNDWVAEQKSKGFDGVKLSDEEFGGTSYIAFDPAQIKSAIGNNGEFDPQNQNILKQADRDTSAPRGQIRFGESRQFSIDLFKNADRSTFLHETGHFFLEVFGDLASAENAPDDIKADYKAMLDWFGVADRGQIETKHHEQFARGFEQYLGEGKAPSLELQSMFSRFASWLLGVYKSLRRLNVPMTDEVRGLMDRMLATQEEIEAAKRRYGFEPLLKEGKKWGLSETLFKRYLELYRLGELNGLDRMRQRAYDEAVREQKAEWKAESEAMEPSVRAELESLPVYRALEFLKQEGNKLSKDELLSQFDQAYLNKNLRWKGVYSPHGTVSPAAAAEQFGYPTVQAMIDDIIAAKPIDEAVKSEINRRMKEKHGDLLTDASITDKAEEALHNNKMAQAVEAEIKILSELAGERPLSYQSALIAARYTLQNKPLKGLTPESFLRAERRNVKAAIAALEKNNRAEALKHLRARLMNMALYSEAVKIEEQTDKLKDFARKLRKKDKQEKIAKAGQDYWHAINSILQAYGFAPKLPTIETNIIDKLTAIEDRGYETSVSDLVMDRIASNAIPNFDEITVEEMRDVYEALKNLNHLAKAESVYVDKDGNKLDKASVADQLANRVRQTWDLRPVSISKLRNAVEVGAGWTLRPETLVEWLDGGLSGPWHDYYYEIANNAHNKKIELRAKIGKPLKNIVKALPLSWHRDLQKRVDFAGKSWTRGELISMALNLGNESNKEKLMRGGWSRDGVHREFTQADIQQLTRLLTEQEWRFVESLWKIIGSLWPDIVEHQENMNGIPMQRIDASPLYVTTKDGEQLTLDGGYWPLVYDPSRGGQTSEKGAESNDAATAMLSGAFSKATTQKGHTKKRTSFAAPLLLDFQAIVSRHIDNVILDISHRQFVQQAHSILENSTVKDVLKDRVGPNAVSQLRDAMKSAVGADRAITEKSSRWANSLAANLQTNLAVAALGFKVATAVGNIAAAPFQGLSRVQLLQMLKGFNRYYANPKASMKFVTDNSVMMRNRMQDIESQFAADIDALDNSNFSRIRKNTISALMAIHGYADMVTGPAIWLGAYQQAMQSTDGDHKESVRLADKAIRQTQTASAGKDKSPAERVEWLNKVGGTLFIGPMIIMNNRMQDAARFRGVVKSWPQAVGVMIAAWMIPAIIFDLAAGKADPDDDDDDDGQFDEWVEWAARKIAFYPAQTIPILREAASSVEQRLMGKQATARVSPLADLTKRLIDAGIEMEKLFSDEKEVDVKTVKNAASIIALTTGMYPSGAANNATDFAHDLMMEEYTPESPLDYRYLFIKRPKE